MKQKVILLLCAGMLLLSGCASGAPQQDIPEMSEEVSTEPTEEETEPIAEGTEPTAEKTEPITEGTEPTAEEAEPITKDTEPMAEDTETGMPETEEPKEEEIERPQFDDSAYIGEYLDKYVEEPNLEIAKGDDGKYIVQIGIYRLTFLDDGIGELTEEGMAFTATDAAGNPISGMITVEGETATVTFTDSTWDYLENGSAFEYTKSSDTPNIYSWSE